LIEKLARYKPVLIFLFLPLLAETVSPLSNAELNTKWTLQYGIEWRLVRAGTAKLIWTPEAKGYQADMHIESAGLVSKLYRVNDNYRASLNDKLCASTTVIDAEEGKRKRETKITYDAGKAKYLERDLLRNADVLAKETPVPACVFEYLGALHKLRGMRLEVGQSAQLPMSSGKKFAAVRAEAQEREEVKTGLGTFKTVRYEIFLFNDVLVNRKARLFVWLTDDARAIPVQLRARMQFLIGTINLLVEKEGT
jgi:hypothetical protein